MIIRKTLYISTGSHTQKTVILVVIYFRQLQEDAESRKQELSDLLTEHAQLVQEVETMEVTAGTPGSDKENESFSLPTQKLSNSSTK